MTSVPNFKSTLLPHQVEAITKMEYMRKNFNGGLLGDFMGLGKTVSTLAHIEKSGYQYILIVSPLITLYQWESEILKHTMNQKPSILIHHGQERRKSFSITKKFVITTYGVVRTEKKKEKSLLFDFTWDCIIADECHCFRNPRSKLYEAMCGLKTKKKWGLSGTIFNNTISDVVSLCTFVGSEPYNDGKWWKALDESKIAQWRKDQLIMRGKEILSLPPIFHKDMPIKFKKNEQIVYDHLVEAITLDFKILDDAVKNKRIKMSEFVQFMLVHLLRLRQVCNDPCLPFLSAIDHSKCISCTLNEDNMDQVINETCHEEEEEKEENEVKKQKGSIKSQEKLIPLACGKHKMCQQCHECLSKQNQKEKREIQCIACSLFYQNKGFQSTKTSLLMKMIKTFSKEKIIVFSQWVKYLDIIEIALENEKIQFLRIDGKIADPAQRNAIKQKFEQDENIQILLVSLHACSLGLNLTCASVVIMMDQWWNPFVEDQAENRVHRIGQTKPVKAIYIKIDSKIEIVLDLIKKLKRSTAKKILEGGIEVNSSVTGGLNADQVLGIMDYVLGKSDTPFKPKTSSSVPQIILCDE